MSYVDEILSKTRNFDTITPSENAKALGLSYMVTCFICDKDEIADKGRMPDGWKVVKGYGYKLCPVCADKLRKVASK